MPNSGKAGLGASTDWELQFNKTMDLKKKMENSVIRNQKLVFKIQLLIITTEYLTKTQNPILVLFNFPDQI